MASSSHSKPIPTAQFSTIVSRAFNKVTVSTVHGYRVYKGLRRSDIEDKECEPQDTKHLAEEHVFFFFFFA